MHSLNLGTREESDYYFDPETREKVFLDYNAFAMFSQPVPEESGKPGIEPRNIVDGDQRTQVPAAQLNQLP
ncbi:MAG: hypothetical protein LBU36_05895 [Clostridiales bacterium]|jgi:hypothetical protein|nr:hypothetical protein [Clostridiales bacterium]